MPPFPFSIPPFNITTDQTADIVAGKQATAIAQRILGEITTHPLYKYNRNCEVLARMIQKNLWLDAFGNLSAEKQKTIITKMVEALRLTLGKMSNGYMRNIGDNPGMSLHSFTPQPPLPLLFTFATRYRLYFPRGFKNLTGNESNDFTQALQQINKEIRAPQLYKLMQLPGLFSARLPAEVQLLTARFYAESRDVEVPAAVPRAVLTIK